jgi:deazaflavin-dependent oxidoreductase (nitroreductase family)
MSENAFGFTSANAAQRALRRLAGTAPMSRFLAKTMHHLDGPLLRRTDGRRSVTTLISGMPMVQLTTTGAKTGLPRSLPIIGVPDGDRLVLVASNYGQAKHPAWYHNLTAHPRCTVAYQGKVVEADAYEAEGQERERLLALDLSVYPARRHYQARAGDRRIPVMVLVPVSTSP